MMGRAPLVGLVAAGLALAPPAAPSIGAGAAGGLTEPPVAEDRAVAPEPGGAAQQAEPVVVGSKPFAESFVLAEMFAQLLEARGFRVDRRLGLGATEIAFQALRNDGIHVYPEYTGTGLVAVLGEAPRSDPAAVLRRVRAAFADRWGVHWLAPLGFQNTYAIAVTGETADAYDLATLSDLSRAAPELTAGLSPDFLGRDDGLPGLREAYDGMEFGATRSLLQAVKYQALAAGEVDVIDGYSTDGQIARYDLVVLEDDRRFFPAYEAAPLVSPALWNDRPDAVAALSELSGLLSEPMMRRLNRRVEVDGDELADVARDALVELRLVAAGGGVGSGTVSGGAVSEGAAGAEDGGPAAAARSSRYDSGLVAYMWDRRGLLWSLTLRHLLLVGVSLLAAILIAVPLGLALERMRGAAEGTIRAVGLLQTIPSIALLAFMIPLIGIGVTPALVALFLYSLYPILRNTYTGVRDASPEAVGAAEALGMTRWQQLRWVRLPLAAPVIMAGVRTAAVITVGTATLAAFIGAGGLGDPIVSGLALSDNRMILSGAVPAAVLALVVDMALAGAERVVRPRGVGST